MSRISVAEVKRIARLARIALGDGEAEAAARELEAILGYVAQLEALDASGVEPTSHVMPLATPTRTDEPFDSLSPEEALANAPAVVGTAFAVPQVVDSGAGG